MTQSNKRKFWNAKTLVYVLVCGLTILVVAFGVQILLPNLSHAKQGAIVVGWMIFCLCFAPLLSRRARADSADVAKHDRVL